jgi:hypothetical protein
MKLSKKLRDIFINDRLTLDCNSNMIEVTSIGSTKRSYIPGLVIYDINIEFGCKDNWDLVDEFKDLFASGEKFSVDKYIDLIISDISIDIDCCRINLNVRGVDPNRKDWRDWFYK